MRLSFDIQINDFPAAALNTCLFAIPLANTVQTYGNCLKDMGKPKQAVQISMCKNYLPKA